MKDFCLKHIKRIRNFLLRFTVPMTKMISKVSFRSKDDPRLLELMDWSSIIPLLSPGYIILTRMKGELSNHGIPGFWTHSAMVAGSDIVVEATTTGVHKTDLKEFMEGKDYVALYAPYFGSPAELKLSVVRALTHQGKPYDYRFEFSTSDNQAFYCSELVWDAYSNSMETCPFVPRVILGEVTIAPQDFHNANTKFTQLWCSAQVGDDHL